MVRHYALPRDGGVLVTEAVAGGAASRAGLRDGDLIIAFNGSVVERTDDLHRLLTGDVIDVPVILKVIRGTELLELTAVPTDTR